jgi:CRP-like cAMP-binding protein
MDGQLAHLLASVYLFAQTSAEDLSALTALAEAKQYSPGDYMYRAGDRADALYVVVLGTIDIVAPGKSVPVVSIGSGQLIGELAFFARGERLGSAVARETTRTHRIAYEALARLLAERSALERLVYRNACGFMARHLQQMAQELDRRYL